MWWLICGIGLTVATVIIVGSLMISGECSRIEESSAWHQSMIASFEAHEDDEL